MAIAEGIADNYLRSTMSPTLPPVTATNVAPTGVESAASTSLRAAGEAPVTFVQILLAQLNPGQPQPDVVALFSGLSDAPIEPQPAQQLSAEALAQLTAELFPGFVAPNVQALNQAPAIELAAASNPQPEGAIAILAADERSSRIEIELPQDLQAANLAGRPATMAVTAEPEFALELESALIESPTQANPSAAAPVAVPGEFSGWRAEPAVREPAHVASTTVAVPLRSPAWGDSLGQRVVWMANEQHQVAELRLDPPNLGPMEVRLSIDGDQANVMFISSHSAVREAIQAALPRLEELLLEGGLTLNNASVSAHTPGNQGDSFMGHNGSAQRGVAAGSSDEGVLAIESGQSGQLRRLIGLVDIFA